MKQVIGAQAKPADSFASALNCVMCLILIYVQLFCGQMTNKKPGKNP